MRGEFPELNEVRKKSIHTIIRHDHMSKHNQQKSEQSKQHASVASAKRVGRSRGDSEPRNPRGLLARSAL